MFGSSLPPVVGKRAHVFFMLFVFVCLLLCPTLIVLCFLLCLRLVSCVPYVSLVYPFLSSSCVLCTLCFQFLWFIHFCLRLVSCVPYVSSFSGLSIFVCSVFSNVYFLCNKLFRHYADF